MVTTALRLLVLGAAAVAVAAQVAQAHADSRPAIGLTDVSGGSPAACAIPRRDAVCAPLFDGTSPLFPGGPAQVRQVRIGYAGDRPAQAVGLYVSDYAARRPSSAPSCTAADPGDRLDVTVSEGTSTLYSGTLAGLAAGHSAPPDAIPLGGSWSSGAAHTYTISVALDASAGNAYMGCVTTAGFVWLAEQ